MFRHAAAAALLLVAAPATAAPAGPVHAVVNIDLMPSDEAAGSAIVTDFVGQARHDPALLSVTLIRQTAAPNHLILDEAFVDAAAYRRFTESASARAMRAALYPHLGSPWDERLGEEIAR